MAAIAPDEGKTSFYKMRGNADLVGIEKPNFLKWISAVRVILAGINPMPRRMRRQRTSQRSNGKFPRAGRPAPASAMRYASFAAPNNKVDISVVTFPGDGGDDLGNINRWRQQLGLPPADANASNIVPLKTNETTFSTIDIAGANTRTVAAWTRKDGRAWFFKLTGPSNGVEKERPNFVKFVQSVRF